MFAKGAWVATLPAVLRETSPRKRWNSVSLQTESLAPVFWNKRNRGDHRYYLLPGMGRSNRRRHKQYFHSAIVVGLIVSAILCALLYYFSQPRL
jgi:hypothetical protein